MKIKNMKRLLVICMLGLHTILVLGQSTKQFSVEAASPDPTLSVRGPEITIDFINDCNLIEKKDCIALLTSEYGKKMKLSSEISHIVQVDRNMKIISIYNNNAEKNHNLFTKEYQIKVPLEGFILLNLNHKDTKSKKYQFMSNYFRVGDIIKLRTNGEICSLKEIVSLNNEQHPLISLVDDHILTVTTSQYNFKGNITNYKKSDKYVLLARKGDTVKRIYPNSKGEFCESLDLVTGCNYYNIELYVNGEKTTNQPVVIYSKKTRETAPELIMWVEQFPNAKTLVDDTTVCDMINKIKKAGYTSIGLDVKGPEGYVSYRKNDLSHTPYFTSMRNPKKNVKDTGFDLLESIIRIAHKEKLKVYASFNFFTEGNITTGDYAILDKYKDWEEVVQYPADKGKLLRITDSSRGKDAAKGKFVALAFVNPSNKEVQDFQLLRVEEVLKNYDIDGVILDRCRYDNLYADFSHITRNAFEEYLKKEGKTLENFPADAFKINQKGELIKGRYYNEWITFRSQTISDFAGRVRELINKYKSKRNPNLKMAAYVGSWYEAYYQNGVNWASRNFKYNDFLDFPESDIYNEKYSYTSYLNYLDFLMIGTYYKTSKEVKRYITLGNILTCGELPILGSMSLPDLKVEEQGQIFKTSIKHSDGLMVFDYCYVDWLTFFEQMRIALSNKK